MLAAGVALVVLAGLWFLLARSRLGVGMRAAAADGPTAALMGIRLSRTGATGWALAGVLAALAGIFLTLVPGARRRADGGALGLPRHSGLGARRVRLGAGGAVIGGLVIGLVTSLTVGYQSRWPSSAAASARSSRTSS